MFEIMKGNWSVPEKIRTYEYVILQFGTKTCTPCLALAAKLKEWSSQHPETEVIYIPVERFTEESAQMGVLSSPSVMTYIDGQLCQKESGYFSLDSILERFERLMRIRKDGTDAVSEDILHPAVKNENPEKDESC